MAALDVRPIAGALGAEIHGINLASELDSGTVAAIRRAFLDHLVIFFRDQQLPPERFLAFARRLGTPVEYPLVKGIDGYPEIIRVAKLEDETVNFGGIWHSDTTYLEAPPMGTMLVAREVPPIGGDTLFANMYLAYETLSGGMKRLLEGLKGISTSVKADATRTREDRIKSDPTTQSRHEFVAEHPVVRTHPETGRKALYVNVAHTVRFVLGYLFQHQVRPECTCRFAWRVGSLAFWDNRATQHNPVNDYHGYRRVMHRITLAGDRPR